LGGTALFLLHGGHFWMALPNVATSVFSASLASFVAGSWAKDSQEARLKRWRATHAERVSPRAME